MTLMLSPTNRFFLADGQPFFYLADTVWSAFTSPTMEEWRHYLSYRRRQGFTALQISILPILHDASESSLGYAPFALDEAGKWDFSALPDEIARSADLKFYMFQSGHHVEEHERAYTLAEQFSGKEPTRPVVNGEPPYEGHGHGFRYTRFSAAEVRCASWQSLLAGASAGITYGAHGIWSWHRTGSAFTSVAFSIVPFDWHDALLLDGA